MTGVKTNFETEECLQTCHLHSPLTFHSKRRFRTSKCKTLLDVWKSQSRTVWSYAPMALWPQPSNQASGWARLFKAKLVCFHVDDQHSNITQYIVCAYGDCLIRILCQMITRAKKLFFYVLIRWPYMMSEIQHGKITTQWSDHIFMLFQAGIAVGKIRWPEWDNIPPIKRSWLWVVHPGTWVVTSHHIRTVLLLQAHQGPYQKNPNT